MSRILVTGADGFIGSHLTEMLVRDGYEVIAFVKYNSLGSWVGWIIARVMLRVILMLQQVIYGMLTAFQMLWRA